MKKIGLTEEQIERLIKRFKKEIEILNWDLEAYLIKEKEENDGIDPEKIGMNQALITWSKSNIKFYEDLVNAFQSAVDT